MARRSCGDPVTAETGVYLGDTLGEMGLFYRLAPVTFLGGSFNDAGGHNPVEAVLLGSALVTGPKVANARAVYKDLWEQGAALKAAEPAQLAAEIARLMDHPDNRKEQVDRAMNLVIKGRGALNRTADLLKPMLAETSRADTMERGDGQGA
jgi:3-deoxy-D-manno-octulosonic-acid transferase